MKNVKWAGDRGVAGTDICEIEEIAKRICGCVDIDTRHLYAELSVDGEMIPWPYLPIFRTCADLESLASRPNRIDECLPREQ